MSAQVVVIDPTAIARAQANHVVDLAKYVDAIYRHLIDLKEDGSFKLDQKYFNYLSGLTMTSRALGVSIDRNAYNLPLTRATSAVCTPFVVLGV